MCVRILREKRNSSVFNKCMQRSHMENFLCLLRAELQIDWVPFGLKSDNIRLSNFVDAKSNPLPWVVVQSRTNVLQ